MPRVAVCGIGSIGSMVVKAVLERGWVVSGAIDSDPSKVGRDLGEVASLGRPLGVEVTDSADSFRGADLAFVTTTSRLEDASERVLEAVRAGANVISSCEELAYPWIVDEDLSEDIDGEARSAGVTVVGAGVNPGFLMDALPAFISLPCLRVDRFRAMRVIDASKRRAPFQKKVGAGLSVREFEEAIRSGRITAHVGLAQSTALVARALGWPIDSIREEGPEPVLADREVDTGVVRVGPGLVAGVRQRALLSSGGVDRVELMFEAYVGAPDQRDEVEVEGLPPVRMRIEPCVHGDWGTVGVLVNLAPAVVAAEPGLTTVVDLMRLVRRF
ncbi:MAG: dihydrodipicolinate reductase [Thermoproteota archaeon]|nr:MAG: dihydrodipicolinate reductase [Candidatus Korarchaeota archaeon]